MVGQRICFKCKQPNYFAQTSIKMLDRDSVIGNYIFLGETISMRGLESTVDLIMFEMTNFDVILDINFLKRYRVEIDYMKNKI